MSDEELITQLKEMNRHLAMMKWYFIGYLSFWGFMIVIAHMIISRRLGL